MQETNLDPQHCYYTVSDHLRLHLITGKNLITLNCDCLLSKAVMMSLQVVFLLMPEIHLVTSSTITGTSTLSSLTQSWLVELDKCLRSLVDLLRPLRSSSFLDNDLLLEPECSLGCLGKDLCLDLCW